MTKTREREAGTRVYFSDIIALRILLNELR